MNYKLRITNKNSGKNFRFFPIHNSYQNDLGRSSYVNSAKRRGFTLIELLVVVAIIGILAAIMIASLSNARSKARDTERVSDVKQLITAVELYYSNNGNYPPDIYAGTLPLVNGPVKFISQMPYDPLTGLAYQYSALGSGNNCNGYHIGALLENTVAKTLDADTDAVASVAICAGSAQDFEGADPVYDVER